MTVALTTLGCKLNYAETATYARELKNRGWVQVQWTEPADFYVINTCAVTAEAERKSRNAIHRAHRTAPGAKIAVVGCYAALDKAGIGAMEGVWRVFGAAEKASLVQALLAEEHPETAETPFLVAYSAAGGRTRGFLKVQDGCDNHCAYCTVPLARGESRSMTVSEAVHVARRIASEGIREIVLTGVNTGDFGRKNGETFLDLLRALEPVEGISRYRISSIEPNLLSDGIIDFVASSAKFQPHFHIPLQSGSDSLLSAMGRRYDTALFADRIRRIRAAMERPGKLKVFLGIDVIAGLPGERAEDFEQTIRFLETEIRPAHIHAFPYSVRPGTAAASMPQQVPTPVKRVRTARLEALGAALHQAFLEQNKGLRAEVLWESTRHDDCMEGYTGNYIRASRPYDAARVGQLEEIVL